MAKYVFRFRGSVSEEELKRTDRNSQMMITHLEEARSTMRSQIESEISRDIPEIDRLHVSIDFEMGSIDWIGEVIVYLDWMARLGGSAAFLIMIKDTIRRGVDRILAKHGIPSPRTAVGLTYPLRVARLMYSSESHNSGDLVLGAILALASVNTLLLLAIFGFLIHRNSIDSMPGSVFVTILGATYAVTLWIIVAVWFRCLRP